MAANAPPSNAAMPQRWRRSTGAWIASRLGLPDVAAHSRRAIEQADCRTGLDLGCGVSSHLSALRPEIQTFGVDVDAESIAESKRHAVHNGYALADIIKQPIEELRAQLLEAAGHDRFDVVPAYGVIEHVTKLDGWELLEKCEALANKLVILETPNGFVPQGPEFGNPFQRHLSGWFRRDFEGRGYRVLGTTGTRYVRGYMGQARLPIPGALLFDQVVLCRLLRCEHAPQHAFNLTAIKDLRGVPARYASREDFQNGRQAA